MEHFGSEEHGAGRLRTRWASVGKGVAASGPDRQAWSAASKERSARRGGGKRVAAGRCVIGVPIGLVVIGCTTIGSRVR